MERDKLNFKLNVKSGKRLSSGLALVLIAIAMIGLFAFGTEARSPQKGADPWTKQQLMEPADLAKKIEGNKMDEVYLYSIGPSPIIKYSLDAGATRDKKNLDAFAATLQKLPKDANVVVYCGCCPFKNCPNVRPAFSLLNEMKFTNHKLLNLPQNIKTDWIDKGYPLVD